MSALIGLACLSLPFVLIAAGVGLVLKQHLLPGDKDERELRKREMDLDRQERELDDEEREFEQRKRTPVARRLPPEE